MFEMLESVSQPILNYSSIGLFTLLAMGIVGLPVPDETLLVSAGFLMTRGKIPIIPTMIAAYAGSIVGISISYVIGCTAGHYLVTHYGSWVGITRKRIDKTHEWFHRIGKWALFFGYFIPGVRHLTGYVAGTFEEGFAEFAKFAFSGAFAWVSVFLFVGYMIGR